MPPAPPSRRSLYNGVILRDFSPEGPALSEVEGIWRAEAQRPTLCHRPS